MKDKYRRSNSYVDARKRLNNLKGFYHHLFWYVLVNIFVFVMVYVNVENKSDVWHFGTFSTAIFWGIGLLFHAIGIFGKRLVFSKKWEEKKIKQYMDNDKF